MKLKPSLLLNSSLHICPLTFITGRFILLLRISSFNAFILWLVRHQLRHVCLACMMRCVTSAMVLQFIDDNILKSFRMGLTNHTWPISHHIRLLVIIGLGVGTHILMHEQKRFQETRRLPTVV